MVDNIDAPAYPTFAEMTATFAKISALSFGGPAGQIALMHKVLVEEEAMDFGGAIPPCPELLHALAGT